MRLQIDISGKKLLLTEAQLSLLLTAVQDAEMLGEKHMGNGLGSQGYQKSYIPVIELKQPHEWLTTTVVSNEFIESTKLIMVVNKDES